MICRHLPDLDCLKVIFVKCQKLGLKTVPGGIEKLAVISVDEAGKPFIVLNGHPFPGKGRKLGPHGNFRQALHNDANGIVGL